MAQIASPANPATNGQSATEKVESATGYQTESETLVAQIRQYADRAKQIDYWRICCILFWIVPALAWDVFGAGVLSPLYFIFTSDGFRFFNWRFGTRISKFPLLGDLADYDGWHKLDIAGVSALALMVFTAVMWTFVLRERLLVQGNRVDAQTWKLGEFSRVCRAIAYGVLSLDFLAFLFGITELGQEGEGSNIFFGVLLSLLYVLLILAFSLGNVYLWSKVTSRRTAS
ncbi:MAG: hypothetical protein ACJ8C4_16490 [Gemmataceae bacterium]